MKRKRITTGKKRFTSGRAVKVARKDPALSRINEHAAGIDIGAMSHFVAVPPASCATPVREFGVFTRDLYAIADWLKECGVRSVAMESTGVYWVPLYEVLEERGFEVKLVDVRMCTCTTRSICGLRKWSRRIAKEKLSSSDTQTILSAGFSTRRRPSPSTKRWSFA